MTNNIVIIINSEANSEILIKQAINCANEQNNIYLIASPNIRFINELIKYYENSLKEWIIHPIDTDDNIHRIIKNFNLKGNITYLPESYNRILNLHI